MSPNHGEGIGSHQVVAQPSWVSVVGSFLHVHSGFHVPVCIGASCIGIGILCFFNLGTFIFTPSKIQDLHIMPDISNSRIEEPSKAVAYMQVYEQKARDKIADLLLRVFGCCPRRISRRIQPSQVS
jgi:hypothetical protein